MAAGRGSGAEGRGGEVGGGGARRAPARSLPHRLPGAPPAPAGKPAAAAVSPSTGIPVSGLVFESCASLPLQTEEFGCVGQLPREGAGWAKRGCFPPPLPPPGLKNKVFVSGFVTDSVRTSGAVRGLKLCQR